MGGAVKSVGNAATDYLKVMAAPIYAPTLAIKNLAQGQGAGAAIGGALQPAAQVTKSAIGGAVQGIMGAPAAQNLPSGPSGPTADQLAAQQAAAARQQEIDLRTDRPGRSQTILSDNSAYPYRMV